MVEDKLVERQEVSAVHRGKIYRAHYYVSQGGELIVEAHLRKVLSHEIRLMLVRLRRLYKPLRICCLRK